MKRKIIGVLSFIPVCSALVLAVLMKIEMSVISSAYNETGEYTELSVLPVLITAFLIIGILSDVVMTIIFFVHNCKDIYKAPDKRLGWGYMLVMISVVAVPAYWYYFLRKK